MDVEDVKLEPVLRGCRDLATGGTPGTVAENHGLAGDEPTYGRCVPALRAIERHAGTLDQAVAIHKEYRRRHGTSLPHQPGWIGWLVELAG
jgi:hypothetical protein